jgi:signal transduction histidine kinase/DNA-binding response OmpR family regulator
VREHPIPPSTFPGAASTAVRRAAAAAVGAARRVTVRLAAPARHPAAGLMTDLAGDLNLAVVITDGAGTIRDGNAAAGTLLDHPGLLPARVLDPRGLFLGQPVEDGEQLGALVRFLGRDAAAGHGEVTLAASRRRVAWAGRVLDGTEGLGGGRLFLMRDVTEERRFETLKGEFLATVSHELRTPLTALLGSLQLVLARATGLAETDRGLVEIGIKNTERLIRLINDLLDIDRLEQGALPFEFTTLDAGELVRGAVGTMAAQFAERGLRVTCDIRGELPTVHGDRDRLRQVVLKLLDNARKYAPPGSTVVVRAAATDAGVQVDVCDRGPGIPPAEQPHVFERFWQADRGGQEAGAGLGLAICRAIVLRHGGRIWIDSEEGRGTTASFFLPRSALQPAADEPPAAPGAPPADTRILLVEDEPDVRAVIRGSLEQDGYRVIEAPTGGHAVRLARRERPAAVLLDLVLPDISGYDVLRILKNSPDTAAIPVVALSIEPERDLARRLGAWDALQKPIDFGAVRGSLGGALRSRGRAAGRLVLGLWPSGSRDLALLACAFEEDRHEVYRAPDLTDLTRWAAEHCPDVLVLDGDLFTESQAEVAQMLRSAVAGRPIPLVFVGSGAWSGPDPSGWVRLRKPTGKDDVLEAAGAPLAPAA